MATKVPMTTDYRLRRALEDMGLSTSELVRTQRSPTSGGIGPAVDESSESKWWPARSKPPASHMRSERAAAPRKV
jgi:hypothetical protein